MTLITSAYLQPWNGKFLAALWSQDDKTGAKEVLAMAEDADRQTAIGRVMYHLPRRSNPTLTQIWYMKPGWFATGSFGGKPDPQNLAATHVHLKDVSDPPFEADVPAINDYLELIFKAQQGEFWSPNGEARALIQAKGLGHTSMSVGDVVVVQDKAYLVSSAGFQPLGDAQ